MLSFDLAVCSQAAWPSVVHAACLQGCLAEAGQASKIHVQLHSCAAALQGRGKDKESPDATAKMERDHEREIARAIARRVCVADLLEFRRCTEQLAELHSWLSYV